MFSFRQSLLIFAVRRGCEDLEKNPQGEGCADAGETVLSALRYDWP